jgi:hypothetical protein
MPGCFEEKETTKEKPVNVQEIFADLDFPDLV